MWSSDTGLHMGFMSHLVTPPIRLRGFCSGLDPILNQEIFLHLVSTSTWRICRRKLSNTNMALILWFLLLSLGRFPVFCVLKEPSIFVINQSGLAGLEGVGRWNKCGGGGVLWWCRLSGCPRTEDGVGGGGAGRAVDPSTLPLSSTWGIGSIYHFVSEKPENILNLILLVVSRGCKHSQDPWESCSP